MRTLPRDNLLCSAIMDLFEHVKKDSARDLVKHILENYGDKIQELSYLEIFRELLMKGEQPQQVYANNIENFFMESDDDAARRPAGPVVRGGPLMEHLTMDPEEEAYWNTSDDEEENQAKSNPANHAASVNGTSSPASKPLVDYPSDEEGDENGDADMIPATTAEEGHAKGEKAAEDAASNSSASAVGGPPERLSEKRRREEEDDDELGKLMHNKRRNSSSASMNAAAATALRKKKSFAGRESPGSTAKKIAISLTPALKASAVPDEEAR